MCRRAVFVVFVSASPGYNMSLYQVEIPGHDTSLYRVEIPGHVPGSGGGLKSRTREEAEETSEEADRMESCFFMTSIVLTASAVAPVD